MSENGSEKRLLGVKFDLRISLGNLLLLVPLVLQGIDYVDHRAEQRVQSAAEISRVEAKVDADRKIIDLRIDNVEDNAREQAKHVDDSLQALTDEVHALRDTLFHSHHTEIVQPPLNEADR